MRKNILAIIKELIEYFIRSVKTVFYSSPLDKKTHNNLLKNGFVVLDSKIDSSLCEQIIKEFESCITQDNTVQDNTGSDTRLFYAQNYIEEIRNILNDELFDKIATKFYGKENLNKFSLMNKVVPVDNNLGSGGGWHRDSPISHQLKVLVYLTDVEKGNGQFQYIQNSFKKVNILRSILKYKWGNKYRFTEFEIKRYIKDFNTKVVDLTGKKGTVVIVDTKGIHRGSPILKGERYAVFNYYYSGNIPSHFSKYKTV
jgi:hypothetical protein